MCVCGVCGVVCVCVSVVCVCGVCGVVCVWGGGVIIFVTIGGSGCMGSEECGVLWCGVVWRSNELGSMHALCMDIHGLL